MYKRQADSSLLLGAHAAAQVSSAPHATPSTESTLHANSSAGFASDSSMQNRATYPATAPQTDSAGRISTRLVYSPPAAGTQATRFRSRPPAAHRKAHGGPGTHSNAPNAGPLSHRPHARSPSGAHGAVS